MLFTNTDYNPQGAHERFLSPDRWSLQAEAGCVLGRRHQHMRDYPKTHPASQLHGLKASMPLSLERESKGTSESNISGVQEGIATEPATDQNQPQ